MDAYLGFAKKLLLAFGLVFELPLLITFLALAGAVTHRSLWRFNRWFIVLAFVVAALLTPGPDIISQVGMALPMIALYNLSIMIAWSIARRRERAAGHGHGDLRAAAPRRGASRRDIAAPRWPPAQVVPVDQAEPDVEPAGEDQRPHHRARHRDVRLARLERRQRLGAGVRHAVPGRRTVDGRVLGDHPPRMSS